ncbi:MAG: division/cell wall cluster transcriptional repressor MraZ [Succinivibrio sp.]|nr:division/cell wall cluster transcriptional repressor MraZ [Succinivibrio sp.]
MFSGLLLCGTTEVTLDDKGRFAIPARFRKDLKENHDNQCVVTRNINFEEPCLWVYPLREWEKVQAQLAALPNFGDSKKDRIYRILQRVLIGSAQLGTLDAQGRVLLTQELRQAYRLNKKAYLVGCSNKFELWSEEAYLEQQKRDEEALQEGLAASFDAQALQNLRL